MMRNSALHCKDAAGGFTLIEVLIAMALLVFISLAIYQVTVNSFDVTHRLSNESNDLMGMAVTLQAMEDDLSTTFTPNFTEPKTPFSASTGDQSPKLFWSQPARADGLRRARFLGTKERFSFVSNGNVRVQQDAPESDMRVVVWEVQQTKAGGYEIRRFSDTNAFDYETTDTAKLKQDGFYTIVAGLSSVEFSYYRREGDKWEENWDSEGSAVKSGYRYPELVRVKLSGPDPTNPAKQLEWESVFRSNIAINAPAPKGAPSGGLPQ